MNRAAFDHSMTVPEFARHCQQYYGAAYESPIEERLAWNLSKLLRPGASLRPQVNITTALGTFRADLVLHAGGKNTVLECDGREFHTDDHRDLVRDLALMHTGLVDQVLRFRGVDLHRRIPEVMAVIALGHPTAFDDRGRTLIRNQASPDLQGVPWSSLLARPSFSVVPRDEDDLKSVSVKIHAPGSMRLGGSAVQRVQEGLRDRTWATLADAVEATRFRL